MPETAVAQGAEIWYNATEVPENGPEEGDRHMNKTTKYILYSVGAFAASIVLMAVVRSLVRGVPITNGFKDWLNWIVAASVGVSTYLSCIRKDQEKEAKEKAKKDQQ